jgi:CTP:molybdopterin cytidylyltransferase MocA
VTPPPEAPGTAAVLLAAGGGTRYTASGGIGHKLTARFRGRTVAEWAVGRALAAQVGPVSVVVGPVEVPVPAGVHVVPNPAWDRGLATSLQVALAIARRAGYRAVVIGLADQPLVEAEAWRRVAQAPAGRPIAVATYGGRRSHPVRLAAEVWPLLPTSGDRGARAVMRQHPELVAEVPSPGHAADIDTVEDLSRWS